LKGKEHMRNLLTGFWAIVISLTCADILAAPANSDATAAVSCTVDSVMEWAGNFADITIADHITAQSTVVAGSAVVTLYTNGDVTISADNTTAARLTQGSDFLATEYRLEYDGNGSAATGGTTVDYVPYNNFLATPSAVTHVGGDGAVDVTLGVRASNQVGNVADAGTYTATQTLTASWAG
jgi:hypothetical protein